MVRATFSGLTTALSALQANQKRLDITGQNLSNMNTIGYTRQQLETSSLNYSGPVGHYMNGSEVVVGFGVHMDKVSQIRDPYLDLQYRAQMTKSGYSNSLQEALDSLTNVLDESSISGIRQAFDDIQSTLTNMHDIAKAGDPIYESELRSRMQALTNLLNDSDRQIRDAEKAEYNKLDGAGTSENGAVQEVNDILRQVGELNRQIKKNQILGQQSLELQDTRNVLLDELSSYLPIEITYFKDKQHDGLKDNPADPDNPLDAPEELYDYDSNGNIIGKKEWPDDLKVELVYKDEHGNSQRLTLINGTTGKGQDNYGKLEMAGGSSTDPTAAAIKFTGAQGSPVADTTASATGSQFDRGSIQAGLDMLGKTANSDNIKGYQYYTQQLDLLAQTFANTINGLNKQGVQGNPPTNADPYLLLVNKTSATDSDAGITAANITIGNDWKNGRVSIGSKGDSPTDTLLNMLKSMSDTNLALGNKSFADFMNNVSTTLANDSSSNQNTLKNNVTVLNSIQNSRDSVSGVSLDEEASNMMTYISAYNAASRLMTALDEALNTLISGTGVVGR